MGRYRHCKPLFVKGSDFIHKIFRLFKGNIHADMSIISVKKTEKEDKKSPPEHVLDHVVTRLKNNRKSGQQKSSTLSWIKRKFFYAFFPLLSAPLPPVAPMTLRFASNGGRSACVQGRMLATAEPPHTTDKRGAAWLFPTATSLSLPVSLSLLFPSLSLSDCAPEHGYVQREEKDLKSQHRFSPRAAFITTSPKMRGLHGFEDRSWQNEGKFTNGTGR